MVHVCFQAIILASFSVSIMVRISAVAQDDLKLLDQSMEKSGVSTGIGIDALTAIIFELSEFPKKYEKIGFGSVVVKTRKKELYI